MLIFTQPKGHTKGQKTFFCQNLFQIMYNQKQKSNAHLRKKHKTADRKGWGGGSTLTVSLTVKYPFFFWRLPLVFLAVIPQGTDSGTSIGHIDLNSIEQCWFYFVTFSQDSKILTYKKFKSSKKTQATAMFLKMGHFTAFAHAQHFWKTTFFYSGTFSCYVDSKLKSEKKWIRES